MVRLEDSVPSKTHPRIRYLRTLRRDRGLRDADGVYVAEGIHLAHEALQASAPIRLAVLTPRLNRVEGGVELRQRLVRSGAELLEVPDDVLDAIQDARAPQPVVLLMARRAIRIDELIPGRPGIPLVVLAHGVQDPGTLGTMLRSAEAAGATGFAVTGGGADLHHPRTVRATMGACFRLPSAMVPLDDALARARACSIRLVGAAARSGASCHALDLRGPVALLFGAEGAGLPEDLMGRLDGSVHVPMRGSAESLSVSAAAAVVLFEAARQRDA